MEPAVTVKPDAGAVTDMFSTVNAANWSNFLSVAISPIFTTLLCQPSYRCRLQIAGDATRVGARCRDRFNAFYGGGALLREVTRIVVLPERKVLEMIL